MNDMGLFDLTLFDITTTQRVILTVGQFTPCLIAYWSLNKYHDLLIMSAYIQVFYVVFSVVYIYLLSKEKQMAPYTINQYRKLQNQFHKGFTLGVSAFLLITVYGMIVIKIGKIVLPQHLDMGEYSRDNWPYFIIIAITNPFLEEWFWRLLMPKTLRLTFYTGLVLNTSYLLYHFYLFSYFIGFWRSLPLVGTFFSVGRSMTYIKSRYGMISAMITHYGITLSGIAVFLHVKYIVNG